MEYFLDIFPLVALVVFVYMTCVFCIALIKKDNSIVDVAWGIGYILITITGLFLRETITLNQICVSIMVCLWGLRLGAHIFFRNRGKGEDFRYRKWREEWGKYVVIRSFLQVFMLQGIFMLIIALPVIFSLSNSDIVYPWIPFVGVGVWLIGFIWESVADFQMTQFKKNSKNKGKILMAGLWRYSRHPNYFGEMLVWWGIFILALSNPSAWWTILSPLIMTWLLISVSGVPMLEKKYADNPEYQAYQERTSAFFPWSPKQ